MKKNNALSVLLNKLTGYSNLTVDNSPVATFYLNRFLGNWYEIARFDHRFERGMEQTKASYALRKNGKVDLST